MDTMLFLGKGQYLFPFIRNRERRHTGHGIEAGSLQRLVQSGAADAYFGIVLWLGSYYTVLLYIYIHVAGPL